jgi:PAS domain S-box-containing protein
VVNLNKLLPRLGIRLKLAIAFAALAILPLLFVAVVTTRVTVRRLHQAAHEVVAHDVGMAATAAELSLGRLERDVAYLAGAYLATPLAAGRSVTRQAIEGVESFLRHSPGLFQVRLVSPEGDLEQTIRSPTERVGSAGEEAGATYYAVQAARLDAGRRLVIPVELRAAGAAGGIAPLPAVAVVIPVRDPAGGLRGVVVGEALASMIFARLDDPSPTYQGETALVDAHGLLLYHSRYKRDWQSLLAAIASTPSLRQGDTLAAASLFGAGQFLISSAPVQMGTSAERPLMLFRAVPLSVVEAPVREFLGWVAGSGVVIAVVVLGLAALAAAQFTEPIYQLHTEVTRLTRGESRRVLRVETNDELEDLAADFTLMAEALTRHRENLEQLIAERTRDLRKTHAELADILAHSADAIAGVDVSGRIRVWNRGAEALFGYTAAEAIGRGADELLVPPGPEMQLEAEFIRQELETRRKVVNLQTRRLTKAGQSIPVSLTQTVVVDDQKTPQGTSLILRDTSLQAKVEEQMRRSERLAAVSVMAAGLAHELNNPLAIIGNRLEVMEDAVGDGPLRRDLRVLQQHTGRLREVTRDLSRFARDYDEAPVLLGLGETVARVADLLRQPLVSRNVEVDLRSDGAALRVRGGERALETVCMNLMLNAADAMPAGGTVHVDVHSNATGDAVELEVHDEGAGVPPELRERVFEPFFTTKGPQRGMGLGLALCRSIVERHGGRIWVDGPDGGGARFVVALPAASIGAE